MKCACTSTLVIDQSVWSTSFSAMLRHSKYYFIMWEIGWVAMQTVTRECMNNSSYLQYSLIYCCYFYVCTCVYGMFFERCFSNQAHIQAIYTSHNMWELFSICLCNRYWCWCLPASLSYPVPTADNQCPLPKLKHLAFITESLTSFYIRCANWTISCNILPVCCCEHNSPHCSFLVSWPQ